MAWSGCGHGGDGGGGDGGSAGDGDDDDEGVVGGSGSGCVDVVACMFALVRACACSRPQLFPFLFCSLLLE